MQYGLRDWAARQPERHALEFNDQATLTYGELEAMANKFAHLFRHCGLGRGDHAAMILPNGPHIMAATWGGYRAGIYLTPVASTFSEHEINYVVENSTSKVVITDAKFAATVGRLPETAKGVTGFFALGNMAGYDDLEQALASMPSTPISDESPGALMMYSSGTTGAPKGIWRPLVTAEQVGDGPPPFAKDLIEIFKYHPDTRYLSPAPLYHAAPLRWSLGILAAGGTAIIMKKFDAEQALDLLETEAITLSQWVPTMFKRMLDLPQARREAFNAPLHKSAFHAAAPCSVEIKRAMIEWWGPIINEYYAGTESVGLTKIETDEWLKRPGSVGRAYKGEIHVLSPEGEELPAGEVGAIYFGGISKFQYFQEIEKTEARTSPQGFQTLGEIGRVDEDGYLFLSDRVDDTIISGGVNIYPMEIEHALEEHEDIAECGVIGMSDPDYGERPVAFLVFEANVRDMEAAKLRVIEFCKTRLGRTKQPREFHVIDELPRSDAGKLLRRNLRQMLEE